MGKFVIPTQRHNNDNNSMDWNLCVRSGVICSLLTKR